MKRYPHLLYLHGFNSSPQSSKAQTMLRAMRDAGLTQRLTIADIPPQPDQAADYLLQQARLVNTHATLCLCGSSLGGFYATWLAEQFSCRAVLINPAVRPHRLLEKYLGENRNYHTGEPWLFKPQHIDQLKQMFYPQLSHPEHYLVLLQTGDETLDYRDAADYYRDCQLMVEQGGNHAFEHFEQHIGPILQFLGFEPPHASD